jgi:sec-independent protein translocase protein TatC
MANSTGKGNKDGRMSLLEHLSEFRKRLVRASLAIVLGMIGGWFSYNKVVNALTAPFCHNGASAHQKTCGILYINGVLGPLNLKVEIAILLGLFFSSPIWIYQLWAFIAPGLYKKEKRYSIGFVAAGVPFFAGGAYLGYVLIPAAVKFLLGFTPNNLTNLVKIDEYLNFVLRVIFIFGIAFELPVFLVALNMIGILSGRAILKPWRLAIFGITLFAALVVPTGDPFTMLALAVPMVFFYLLAGALGILNDRRRAKKAAVSDNE